MAQGSPCRPHRPREGQPGRFWVSNCYLLRFLAHIYRSSNESQPPPPRPDIAPLPAPPAVLKPETRARARKNGCTPARRTRKPRAKKIQAGEPMNTGPAAIPAAYLPKGPPLPENITDSELGGPDRVMAVVMAGLRYPSVSCSYPRLSARTDIWKGTALPPGTY